MFTMVRALAMMICPLNETLSRLPPVGRTGRFASSIYPRPRWPPQQLRPRHHLVVPTWVSSIRFSTILELGWRRRAAALGEIVKINGARCPEESHCTPTSDILHVPIALCVPISTENKRHKQETNVIGCLADSTNNLLLPERLMRYERDEMRDL